MNSSWADVHQRDNLYRMTRHVRLTEARDAFAALLARRDAPERQWQQLFSTYPTILAESLPLRIKSSQIVSRGRPGRSEADFVIYPNQNLASSATYGVVELKRPSTQILASPRRQVIRLSADAQTAYAQANAYADQLGRDLFPPGPHTCSRRRRTHFPDRGSLRRDCTKGYD
jgi:hypothetical protein